MKKKINKIIYILPIVALLTTLSTVSAFSPPSVGDNFRDEANSSANYRVAYVQPAGFGWYVLLQPQSSYAPQIGQTLNDTNTNSGFILVSIQQMGAGYYTGVQADEQGGRTDIFHNNPFEQGGRTDISHNSPLETIGGWGL